MSQKQKIEKSLDALRKGIESLPSGDLKDDAEGAVNFLSRVLGRGPQPLFMECPGGTYRIE